MQIRGLDTRICYATQESVVFRVALRFTLKCTHPLFIHFVYPENPLFATFSLSSNVGHVAMHASIIILLLYFQTVLSIPSFAISFTDRQNEGSFFIALKMKLRKEPSNLQRTE